MNSRAEEKFTCPICHKLRSGRSAVSAEMVHEPTADIIQRDHPEWSGTGLVCRSCLNEYRARYVEEVLREERGELDEIENEVVKSLREHELLARNVDAEFEEKFSVGQRIADRVASFGGSWTFILIFGSVILVWIVFNSVSLLRRPFDPYPYILLNLALSCLAAVQAPIIMMSQNRQEAKDRARSEQDYRVNLKAELEIRHLQSKIDQLLSRQWQRLLQVQKIQVDLLQELERRRPAKD